MVLSYIVVDNDYKSRTACVEWCIWLESSVDLYKWEWNFRIHSDKNEVKVRKEAIRADVDRPNCKK